MKLIITAALLTAAESVCAAPHKVMAVESVSAGPHTLMVRVSKGPATYVQTLKVSQGLQASFVGPVSGGKSMVFNALLVGNPARPEQFNLQYQLELSGGRGSLAPSIQSQSALMMRPGVKVAAVECGAWVVDIGLDAAAPVKRPQDSAWDQAGLGNYRLTAELSRGGARQRCRFLVAPDNQANVVEGFGGAKKSGFILNAMPVRGQGTSVALQYQLEHTPAGSSPLQLQSQENLDLGRKSTTQGAGYKLSLLVEGGSAPTAPAPAAPAVPSASGGQGVPLLR